MNKRYVTVFYVLAAIGLLYFARNSANLGHDFQVFVCAGGKLIHNQDIYKPPFVQNLAYYNSPLFALILSPFANLPIIIPQILWIFFSYYLLYRIWMLSAEYFEEQLPALSRRQRLAWLVIVLVLSCRFIVIDLGFVQLTTFLLWSTLQSLKLFRKGNNVGGAALLALAINIKLLPLPFLLYLLYRKNLKAAALTVLFFVIYLFLPALYVGWDKNLHLIREWFGVINPANKEWTIEAEDGPSSLVALIPVYITHTTGVMHFKRNFIDLDLQHVTLILNAVRIFFILLTLLFLQSPPFTRAKSAIRQYWEMSYIFLIVPLIYPHQQVYAYVYITPVFVYLAWYLVTRWASLRQKIGIGGWILIGIVAVNFSPLVNKGLITKNYYEALLYLRVLPMAAVALVPVLWMCRPKDAEVAAPETA